MAAGHLGEEAGTRPARSVWRNPDFNLLMVGNAASDFGAQISLVAVPLVAVTTLGASAFEVGLMRAAEQIPYLLFVLFAGVAVDRWRRRNMLVSADFGRAVALAGIPVAFSVNGLGISALYVIAFFVGICTVLFDVGSQAYLPRLVERDQLAQGNSALEGARSVALIGGPAIGGAFVSLFGPPIAVVACVVFFLLSALSVWRIRRPEPKPDAADDTTTAISKIAAGFRLVGRSPVLRSMAIIVTIFNFSYAGYTAIYLVYLPVELNLPGYAIGLAFAAMGPGLLVGAFFSSWLPRRFGYGRVLFTAAFASNLFLLAVAALQGSTVTTVVLLMVLNFMYGGLSQTFAISLVSIRQSITPDRLLGRVMATYRFLGVGLVPIGSLVGGFLGEQVGLRVSLFGIALVMCLVPLFFIRSALTSIGRDLPEAAEA